MWLAGARPRTLPAAVVPVAVGTAAAVGTVPGGLIWWRALAALVVSLALQVATNYANDYSDGIRGTDADDKRVGPVRLVGQGPDLAYLGKSVEISRGVVAIDPYTFETSRPTVFAGGDAATGTASLVEALLAGKTAARSIADCLAPQEGGGRP